MTVTKQLPKQAILIVNAKSRQGAAAFEPACAKLKAAGIELLAAHAIEDPKRMGDARRASSSRKRPNRDWSDFVLSPRTAGADSSVRGGSDGLVRSW